MQHNLIIPTLYTLVGISIYATVVHGIVAWQGRSSYLLHGLFGSFTATLSIFIFFHGIALTAQDISTLAWGLRGSISAGYVCTSLLLWFITAFTQQWNPLILAILSLALIGMSGLNWLCPYSIQFEEITGLTTLLLPWGETVTRGVGAPSQYVFLGVTTLIGSCAYMIFLLHSSQPRYGRRAMTIALYLYLFALILGILSRLGLLKMLEPGAFGWIAVILTTSILLIQEYQQQLITSENRFRSLVEQSPLSIQIINRQGEIIRTNSAWDRIFSNHQYPILNAIQDELRQGFAGLAQTLAPKQYQIPLDTGLNSYWLRGHLYPLRAQDRIDSINEVINEVVIIHEDITEQTQLENAMRFLVEETGSVIGDRFFEKLITGLAKIFQADYVFVGVIDWDSQTSPTQWEKLQVSTLAVCDHGQLVENMTYSLEHSPCADVVQSRCSCLYTHRIQQLFPQDQLLIEMGAESYCGTPLTNPKGDLLGIMVVVDSRPMSNPHITRTIFELFAQRAGTEIQYLRDAAYIRALAYEDELTRLPNRARLHEVLSEILNRSLYPKHSGSVLIIDLDRFKTINDALGHDVGDEVLRSVALRLQAFESQALAGEQVFIARLAGDQFVIILSGETTGHSEAKRAAVMGFAQQIMNTLSTPFEVGDLTLNLGASVGLALFPEDALTELDLLRYADMALCRAKQLGRGVVQVYDPILQKAANDRLWLEEGLRRVISNNELVLHFQPQITAHGDMAGAEVLLRWHHPEVGNIPPDRFIPVAEESGLIHSIGRWVLEQSCQRLQQWLQENRLFQGHLSVNVCPSQFSRFDFVDQVQDLLDTYQIDPKTLVLELTETALLHDLQDTIRKLNLCRQKGIKIALDDFGIGYSSLAHLKNLPVDILKIDKAFVQELDQPNEKHYLVQSIIAISQFMELEVIAEGVETLDQRDLLIQFGCETLQGYLFSCPLPEEKFLEWMENYVPKAA